MILHSNDEGKTSHKGEGTHQYKRTFIHIFKIFLISMLLFLSIFFNIIYNCNKFFDSSSPATLILASEVDNVATKGTL
jgi:hypothetical protein